MLIKIKSIVVIVALIVLASCQTANRPAGEQGSSDTLNKEQISEGVKEVVYPLPTPFEMTQMLNDIGASYVSKILNPTTKVDKYMTEKEKAVGLGVYGADLAYTTTYDREQDMKSYLKTVKTLVDALGVNINYDTFLSDEFKLKANNKDTLVKVITNTFYETYSTLKEKNNPEISVMMVSGMWIELMYIATHISKDTYNNTQIVDIIAKQKDSYNKLMELLSKYSDKSDVKDLSDKLTVLKEPFAKIESGLTVDEYNTMLKTIEKVRKEFVQ